MKRKQYTGSGIALIAVLLVVGYATYNVWGDTTFSWSVPNQTGALTYNGLRLEDTVMTGTVVMAAGSTFTTPEGKLFEPSGGATGVTSVATAVNYMGGTFRTVFTLGTSGIATNGSEEGRGVAFGTFPQGRIHIQSAAVDLVVTNTAAFDANPADVYLVGIGTAAAGDDNTLSSTEVDIIAATTLDTTGNTVSNFTVQADFTAGADTMFDGTSTATKLYWNWACADANITNDVTIGVAGAVAVVWNFVLDD